MSWPLGIDGRKAEAGVSLLSGGERYWRRRGQF